MWDESEMLRHGIWERDSDGSKAVIQCLMQRLIQRLIHTPYATTLADTRVRGDGEREATGERGGREVEGLERWSDWPPTPLMPMNIQDFTLLYQ